MGKREKEWCSQFEDKHIFLWYYLGWILVDPQQEGFDLHEGKKDSICMKAQHSTAQKNADPSVVYASTRKTTDETMTTSRQDLCVMMRIPSTAAVCVFRTARGSNEAFFSKGKKKDTDSEFLLFTDLAFAMNLFQQ